MYSFLNCLTLDISIHALRVEGDLRQKDAEFSKRISIHALRVEGDEVVLPIVTTITEFLSTPSGWRATPGLGDIINAFMRFLSTPSGWRATGIGYDGCVGMYVFLSTPSGWRATSGSSAYSEVLSISIHALRVEGDVHE